MKFPEVFTLTANEQLGIPACMPLQGSKSYTNRALIIAALSQSPVQLSNVSESDDSKALCAALERFGVRFVWKEQSVLVHPPENGFLPYQGVIDVGPAGTTMRFLTALCAFIPGSEVELRGSKRMHERPISVLVTALHALGADIEYMENEGCPPLKIKGTLPRASTVTLNGDVSSQYFSALLLIAPLFLNGLDIAVDGEQISRSYIDMTLSAMNVAGITVQNDNYQIYSIPPASKYAIEEYAIEGDASGASYFWGLAALSKKTLCIENISRQSLQGDVGFVEILSRMGASVSYAPNSITVTGPEEGLQAVSVAMESMPDTAQTLAVIAAFARGTTVITGLKTLRIKETDRITALQKELQKCGIQSSATEDSISIIGGNVTSATIATYDDHRMAMSFALLASRIEGVRIEEPAVVTKSFPDFWNELERMGISSQ